MFDRLISLALTLRSGQPIEDGKALYRRACQLVKQAREELAEAGFSQESSDIMLYVFCALLDERGRSEILTY
ncbi:DotU family type IV/VI secretion system protein [Escherichia coli]|nr:DotU family type IV/VI secretion system protein [Escherichia coli]